ncbi:MAG: arginine-tRNA-protein transferase [Candidatus Kapaibacteriota bacterium]
MESYMETGTLLSDSTNDKELYEELYDAFYCSALTPEMMDVCWADGWRHFGTYFFRSQVNMLNGVPVVVLPLRIVIADFVLSKSQRRILRKNADMAVDIRPIALTDAHHDVFHRHKQRFVDNQPETLLDFLSPEPATMPCVGYECLITESETKRLFAASFIDIGDKALSSVYAMFDPEESHRSLGILTLLCEIEYARRLGKKYLYLGYAYSEASFYDYKKSFAALEYYNWRGDWLPLPRGFST